MVLRYYRVVLNLSFILWMQSLRVAISMKVACAGSSLFTGYNESYLAVLSHEDVYFCCIRLGPWTKTCHVTVISFLFHSALIVFSESRKSACEN